MKKKFIGALVIILSLSTVQVSAIDSNNKNYLKNAIESDGNLTRSANKTEVMYGNEMEAPRFVEGKLSKTKVKNNDEALKYLNENMNAFNLEKGEFKFESEEKEDEFSHYKFQYYLNGIEVYGSEIIVHTNKDNIVYAVNGQAEPNIPNENFNAKFKIDENKAVDKVLENMKMEKSEKFKPEVSKYIKKVKNEWKAVYSFDIVYKMKFYNIVIDAEKGTLLEKNALNNNVNAEGEGVDLSGNTRKLNLDYKDNKYYLRDVTNKGVIETAYGEKSDELLLVIMLGQLVFTPKQYEEILDSVNVVESDTNKFEDKSKASIVDAHSNMGKVYSYYKENFGREGFDGNGAKIKAITDVGSEFNNAMSVYLPGMTSSYLVFGNSKEANYAKSLDVIAHEYTHSVVSTTSNLKYIDQSGALNESFADVFGCLIENDSNNIKDETYWEVGEDSSLTDEVGGLRSLDNPKKYGNPDNMKEYSIGILDNGGVHTNSTINSKALCNIAKEIGKKDAEQIYYRALTKYLFSNANFLDARYAIKQAAIDEFGDKYSEIINNAYDSVGIKDEPDKKVLAAPKVIGEVDETIENDIFGLIDCDINVGNYDMRVIVDKDNAAKRIYVEEVTQNDSGVIQSTVLLDKNIDTSSSEFVKEFSFKNREPGRYEYVITLQSDNNISRVVREVMVVKDIKEALDNDLVCTDWDSNKQYKESDLVLYKDHIYTCITEHTSQDSWTPDNSSSLWKKLY